MKTKDIRHTSEIDLESVESIHVYRSEIDNSLDPSYFIIKIIENDLLVCWYSDGYVIYIDGKDKKIYDKIISEKIDSKWYPLLLSTDKALRLMAQANINLNKK